MRDVIFVQCFGQGDSWKFFVPASVGTWIQEQYAAPGQLPQGEVPVPQHIVDEIQDAHEDFFSDIEEDVDCEDEVGQPTMYLTSGSWENDVYLHLGSIFNLYAPDTLKGISDLIQRHGLNVVEEYEGYIY